MHTYMHIYYIYSTKVVKRVCKMMDGCSKLDEKITNFLIFSFSVLPKHGQNKENKNPVFSRSINFFRIYSSSKIVIT